jgi:DNA-binding NtrC family response regulator
MMDESLRILVVDDEAPMRDSLAEWLINEGYQADTAPGGVEALAAMDRAAFDLALVDIKMPGMDGLELLGRIREAHPQTMVIIITAYGSIQSAIAAMKAGATDYLLKPFDPEHLMLLVEKATQHKALVDENVALKAWLMERDQAGFEDLIGRSEPMAKVFAAIDDVAATDAPVLITGETGTGKELVARAIHARSERALCAFVAINCGALTETLLESELFGHERGAFTGAVRARRGRLELADTGTLFLDEVGDISPRMQVDLLRVLEDKTYTRVGGNQTLTSDFRLICATHRDLAALVDDGKFRADFYFRINVIHIEVPPLRARVEDIDLLALHFLERFSLEMGKKLDGFSREALAALRAYRWPGNVRELRNVIERAVVVARGDTIGPDELTFLKPAAQAPRGPSTLHEAEKALIRQCLETQDFNVTRAAEVLGINRGTLSRKMKKYGLVRPT